MQMSLEPDATGVLRCACRAYATLVMFEVAYCDAHAPEPHEIFREDEIIGGIAHIRYLCDQCEMATDWVADSPLASLQLALALPCAQWAVSPPTEIRPLSGADVWEIMGKVDPDQLDG
jgi:hypothetical protein